MTDTNIAQKSKDVAANRPVFRLGCYGLIALIVVVLAVVFLATRLINRPTELSLDTIAGVNISGYEYPIFIEELRVNVVRWILNSGGYNGTYALNGKVQAGVTLDSPVTKIEKLEENRYRITLPRASVISCSIGDPIQSDWSKSMVADWEQAEAFARYQAMLRIRADVVESDVITTTEFKVEQALTDFVQSIDEAIQLEFVFNGSDEVSFDTTCESAAPTEYTYYPDTNEWKPN